MFSPAPSPEDQRTARSFERMRRSVDVVEDRVLRYRAALERIAVLPRAGASASEAMVDAIRIAKEALL